MLYKRLPRLDLSQHTYYLTCCLDRRRPLFKRPPLAQRLIELYAAERDRGSIALHGYVVMPDHYHVLVTLKEEPSVSALVRRVHSLFGRWSRGVMPVSGRVWQRRFYDHVIRDEDDARSKLDYMHGNPGEGRAERGPNCLHMVQLSVLADRRRCDPMRPLGVKWQDQGPALRSP